MLQCSHHVKQSLSLLPCSSLSCGSLQHNVQLPHSFFSGLIKCTSLERSRSEPDWILITSLLAIEPDGLSTSARSESLFLCYKAQLFLIILWWSHSGSRIDRSALLKCFSSSRTLSWDGHDSTNSFRLELYFCKLSNLPMNRHLPISFIIHMYILFLFISYCVVLLLCLF